VAVREEMLKLLSELQDIEGREYSSENEAVSVKDAFLREVESRSHRLADSTKAWKEFKELGRIALPPEVQPKFDRLWQICAAKNLFINPCGELESMLSDYGIEHTTDKRGWITRALRLLPALERNVEKHPWRFMKSIHDHLLKPSRPDEGESP